MSFDGEPLVTSHTGMRRMYIRNITWRKCRTTCEPLVWTLVEFLYLSNVVGDELIKWFLVHLLLSPLFVLHGYSLALKCDHKFRFHFMIQKATMFISQFDQRNMLQVLHRKTFILLKQRLLVGIFSCLLCTLESSCTWRTRSTETEERQFLEMLVSLIVILNTLLLSAHS